MNMSRGWSNSVLCFSILTCGLILGLAPGGLAQSSSEINGLVTDSTNAVIPGATVTVKRLATGDVRTVATNESGNYLLPALEIGEYEISCSAKGFKTEVVRGVVLQIQQKARINFQMQIGEQSA